jgi:uncharacterized protein (TIGR00369 family)
MEEPPDAGGLSRVTVAVRTPGGGRDSAILDGVSAPPPNRASNYTPLSEADDVRWARFGQSERVNFPTLLGFVVEEVRLDYCRMRLPFRTELLQGGGIVHGGAISALLDTVVVPAVGSALDQSFRYATVDLHVQFLSAVKHEDVVAEGWVTKRGRTVVFCESEAFGATTGRLVAKSVLTYNVSRGE